MVRFITFTLFCALAASVYYTVQLRQTLELQRTQLVAKSKTVNELQNQLSEILKKAAREKQTEERAEQSIVAKIRNQLELEKRALSIIQKKIEEARDGVNPELTDASGTQQTQANINEYQRQMREIEGQERSLKKQAHLSAVSNQQDKAAAQAQLNEAIRQTEERIKNSQNEIKERKKRFSEFDQPRMIAEIEVRLKTEKSTLDELKIKKSRFKTLPGFDTTDAKQEVETQQLTLANQKQELQRAISEQKSLLEHLKKDSDAKKRSQEIRKQQLHDLQIQSDAQAVKVKALESQLASETRRLQLLSSPAGSAN